VMDSKPPAELLERELAVGDEDHEFVELDCVQAARVV